MGSCRSTCQNQNQQILSDSICQKELINSEGLKQPIKPPIIMSFQKQQQLELFDCPTKQYQGKTYPTLQITQKEGEEFDFIDENYTKTNQCQKFEECLKLQQDCDSQATHKSLSNSRQLMSEYSYKSLPQKKKHKKKNQHKEGSVKVTKPKNKGKKQDSLFFQRYQREFSLLIQQQLVKTNYYNNFDDSSSIKSILKKPSNRKVRSQSPLQKHVSFSKRM